MSFDDLLSPSSDPFLKSKKEPEQRQEPEMDAGTIQNPGMAQPTSKPPGWDTGKNPDKWTTGTAPDVWNSNP